MKELLLTEKDVRCVRRDKEIFRPNNRLVPWTRIESEEDVNGNETALRTRLGIPLDAEKVIIFGESSHWDPNWLFTTDQYYRWRIRHILDRVVEELELEPRRVFSIESIFFLQLDWEHRPDRRDILVRLINEGRIRLTGSGITTPDMTLPHTESILRDYLLGQEWLRNRAITQEPRLAYLPDDFGYSPAMPSLLQALGYDMAGITRIDGMYFVGSDFRPRSSFPRPGSSAELLLNEHKTQDFVWRAPDGAEVLCHWNAFSYFQGDMLAYKGIIRWMGLVFGIPWRTATHVQKRIGRFVAELEPYSLTPYMFCPIGCDFNSPIPGLVNLLDRYNEHIYPKTGVFAVNAGMDDYLRLVDHYRRLLPVIELDPNPYWMGYYTSRPEAKRLCNRIARKLVLGERLQAFTDCHSESTSPGYPELTKDLEEAWNILVISNHHDFITGTSPDRVWKKEQLPWLQRADAISDSAVERLGTLVADSSRDAEITAPSWWLENGRLEVETEFYKAVLLESVGGCVTSFIGPNGKGELLTGPGNDLVIYRGSGGLWRMGHEYAGGVFREYARASDQEATIKTRVYDGVLEVTVESRLRGVFYARTLWFRADSPIIRMKIEGSAKKSWTVTCRFPTVLRSEEFDMDVPGGYVKRSTKKGYDPTFWPARSFVHLRDRNEGTGLAAFLGGSGSHPDTNISRRPLRI